MRRPAHTLVVAFLAGLLFCLPVVASPQVEPIHGTPTAEKLPPDGDTGPCPTGIIEGPDPIGSVVECEKDPQRDSESAPSDVSRPAIGRHAADGSPFLVWAEQNAGDRDIAYRSWEDGRWGPVHYLTSSLADERDPAIWVADDASVLVVWWSVARGVEVTRRDPVTGEWSINRQVTARGLRPAIAAIDARAVVVFEQLAGDGSREVVVATETPTGSFETRVLATESSNVPLGVGLRRQHEKLRAEWKPAGGTSIAYSELGRDGWSELRTTSAVDPAREP